jgi:glycosyltransferase involved in cell wall biosynthesis
LAFIPVTILFIQVVSACFFKQDKNSKQHHYRPSVAVLMPAHNEALIIEQSISPIVALLHGNDRLIVVADNCTDETANLAEAKGAIVLERNNLDARGKGYALDFGLAYLKTNPPEIVIIIDADCLVDDCTIDLLASVCYASNRPTQALYLMESQPNPSLKARIATFAWHVKNKVRPMGFFMLGLPCQLMGTGMAFKWEHINMVSLASGHIVEDMKLGTDLASLNKAPLFLHEALVTSVFPPSDVATNTQRTRWEHGHLSVIVSEAPKLIYKSIKDKNIMMFGMACDLLVPPIAMLTLICLTILMISYLLGHQMPIFLSLFLIGILLLTIMLAWFKFGRNIITFNQLCYAPIYAVLKIPLYIKFFLGRQVDWVRSKRD